MKVNRLVEIIIILLKKEKITARQLSERFNVSMRTIYRDIEDLSSAGIPVYMNKGKGGGIQLLEEYTLDKNIFNDEEKANILIALKTLNSTKDFKMDSTLEKIQGVFNKGNFIDWIDVDLSPWGSSGKLDERFNIIKESILNENILEFQYVNSQNQLTYRKVEPFKIMFKSQSFYLTAYCLEKNSPRIFRISRMRDVKKNEDKFERKELKNLFSTEENHEEFNMITLKLRFHSRMLFRLMDYYEKEEIKREDSGEYLVTVEFPYGQWIYSHILSYGKDVEVIEPAFIKNNIKDILKETLEKYL